MPKDARTPGEDAEMMGRTPSKKTVQAVRLAVNSASKVQDDKVRAMQIYKDFRWAVKILPERTYQAIEAVLDKTIADCRTKLETPEVRESVIKRFEEMRARVSEFTVIEDETDPTDDSKAG